jgi:hypothetical protein
MRRRLAKSLIAICAVFVSQLAVISSAQASMTKPSAPDPLTVSSGPASLTLNWSIPSDTATGVLNYQVEYSTDGATWGIASNSIAPNTYTYTISSLVSATNYFVRVAAIGSSGLGAYAYPWTKVYGVNNPKRDALGHIQYQLNYGIADTDTAHSYIGSSFTRVRYKMAITVSSLSQWADVNFPKWGASTGNPNGASHSTFDVPDSTIQNLRVPTTNSTNTLTSAEQFTVKTNVTDLTILSSDTTLNGFGLLGRLEIWPWNYDTNKSGITPAGNDSKYDLDDSPALASTYGSFQVHDISDSKTVLAWNMHDPAQTSSDLGINSNPNGSYNPDWTFCANSSGGNTCLNRTPFLLEIFVNNSISTGFQGTGTVSINAISGTISKRTTKAITANTAGPGFVTFFYNGRKITNCVNVATVANVATCNWKPIITGQQGLSASFTSGDGSYTAANSTTLNATTKKR